MSQPEFAAGLLQDGRFARVDPADEVPLVADAWLVMAAGGGGFLVGQSAEREPDGLQARIGSGESELLICLDGSHGLESLPRGRPVVAERAQKADHTRFRNGEVSRWFSKGIGEPLNPAWKPLLICRGQQGRGHLVAKSHDAHGRRLSAGKREGLFREVAIFSMSGTVNPSARPAIISFAPAIIRPRCSSGGWRAGQLDSSPSSSRAR